MVDSNNNDDNNDEKNLGIGDIGVGGWISVVEAAKRLNISDRAVRQRIAEGKLEARKLGKRWQVRLSGNESEATSDKTSATSDKTSATSDSVSDFSAELVTQLRSEVDFLRNQLSEANQKLSEMLTEFVEASKRSDMITMQLTRQLESSQRLLEDLRPKPERDLSKQPQNRRRFWQFWKRKAASADDLSERFFGKDHKGSQP